MPDITAKLSDDELKGLLDLSRRRGVDANTVLKQAIATELLIARNVGPADALLIRKHDSSMLKVVFQ